MNAELTANGWTIPLKEHYEALHKRDLLLADERDRRYAEVNIEREKALKIKERADEVALGLAREIQVYKDEKANQLREQINQERGTYATKEDLASAIREVNAGKHWVWSYIATVAALVIAGLAIFYRSH